MTDIREDTATVDAEAEGPKTERTVAFIPDPRAATLLLTETISQLIAALSIERGLVDLSSRPGLAVAAAFERAGVPYESLAFGQEDHCAEQAPGQEPEQQTYAQNAARFRMLAAAIKEVPAAELGSIDANVVLIPAMVGHGEKLIDFTPGSIPGAVMTQLEAYERSFMVVDTPERGLRGRPDGTYERTLINVDPSASNA